MEGLQTIGEVLDYPLMTVSGTKINLTTVLIFVFVVFVAYLASKLARRALIRNLVNHNLGDEGTAASVGRLVQYLVLGLGVIAGLQIIGINLASVFAASAVFAVGIGFALQNVAQNFVSGIILLAERSIKPGDVIVIDGLMVRVQEIGIRSTKARTLEDVVLIVPNSTLVLGSIHNQSLLGEPVRVRLEVGVAYGTELRRAHAVLLKAAAPLSDTKDPVVALLSFGDSSIDFEVSVWIEDPFRFQQKRSELGFAVEQALSDASIEIAFPQLDVHLKSSDQ